MAEETLKLMELSPEQVPADLKAETYFDFKAQPFTHQQLLEQSTSVCQAIRKIGDYAKDWLAKALTEAKCQPHAKVKAKDIAECRRVRGDFEAIVCEGAVFDPGSVIGGQEGRTRTIFVGPGAKLIGCDLYLNKGDIYVSPGTTIESGAGIKGPSIIGKDCEIRQGAYLRGDCILGDECTIRGEIKNTVLMNKANFPHPSYLGDSICGYMAHFGNQATTANLGIFESLRETAKRHNLKLRFEGKTYDLGTPKMGVVMGDYCQVGCNSATDPGTFLKPYTIAYTLTRITKGVYGPNVILKNKPMEHGVIEKSALNPL